MEREKGRREGRISCRHRARFFPPLSFPNHHHRHHHHPTVYAAGNYTTAQFIKFGIPLQLLQFATVTVIFFLRPWKWALCGASVLLLVAVGASIAVLQGDTLAGTRRRLRGIVGRARGRGLFAEEKAADGAAAAPKVA